MKTNNRIFRVQADYLLIIVQRPAGWKPKRLDDIPPAGEVLSVAHVASFAEARDDVLRCNRIAMRENLPRWAVVQSAGGEL